MVLRVVTRVVRGGWGIGWVGPCVSIRRLQPCTWCYPGVQFNWPDQFPIRVRARLLFPQKTGEPSSADHPWVGPRKVDWDASVYPPPYLRWIRSIERAQLGLTALEFRPLKEQTAKNVSVGCDSAYHACLSLSFLTWTGVMSLACTCTYPRQNHQAWRPLRIWIDNPITLDHHIYPCVIVLVTTLTYL